MGHGEKKLDFYALRKSFSDTTSKVTYTQEERKEKFNINPYDFVPLSGKCQKSVLPENRNECTGKIICSLIPKTDFFIPNTSNDSCDWEGRVNKTKKDGKFVHKAKEFFSYENLSEGQSIGDTGPEKPVIPGSELRGMIRNMYEAFTNSCLSVFESNKQLSSRTMVPNLPGVLIKENGEWHLYPAKSYRLQTRNNENWKNTDGKKHIFYKDMQQKCILNFAEKLYTSDEVYFKHGIVEREKISKNKKTHQNETKIVKDDLVLRISKKEFDTSQKGYLILGGFISSKYYDNIFVRDKSDYFNIKNNIIEEAIVNYNSIIDNYYNNPKINKTLKNGESSIYIAARIDNISDKVYPVWYQIVDEKHVYLSPSCIGRNVYMNKLTDFIDISYIPCNCNEEICEACALFGYVNKKSTHSSMIRFTDACLSEKVENIDLYQPLTTLKILSMPKITSMEMYTHLANGKRGYWTYDFFITKNGKTLEYQPLNSEDVQLNGRKFYYHSNNDYKCSEQTDLNVTVRPIKGRPENKFKFEVYFEHLSIEQLKKLLVVLSLRGNGSDYAYKLGMGKPLGLGSVKIQVDDVWLRTINNKMNYSYSSVKEEYKDYFNLDKIEIFKNLDIDTKEKLAKLTSVKHERNVGCKVSYPLGSKGKDNGGYQWFVQNRGSLSNPIFEDILFWKKDGLLNEKHK